MRLADVIIVLSRPSEAGNVGAVCRAMKNMGLGSLRIVAPEFSLDGNPSAEIPARDTGLPISVHRPCPSQGALLSEAGLAYGGTQAVIRARAVHAEDVWENAEICNTLAEAIKDCSLVIGTTRRRGRRRKQLSMSPAETASFIRESPGKAALVFGSERTGLEDSELELCNFASHIPVDEVFPSLNLSHAVMIYAYELFMKLARPEEEAVKGQWVPMNQEAIGTLVKGIADNFSKLGFYKQAAREEQERFFMDIFSRAAIGEREGRYFSNLITRAVQLALKSRSSPEDPVKQ